MNFKKGDVFTHPVRIDVDWTPGPGQKWADGPKAECIVTAVRGNQVYYKYVAYQNGKAAFVTTISSLANLMEAYK
jgi:hypothetical protein